MLLEIDSAHLDILADPEAYRHLDEITDDEGENQGVEEHRERSDGLLAQLIRTAAVEQAVDTRRSRLRGQEADEEGPDEATHDVDADDEEDYALDIWAGIVPVTTVIGTPEPDPRNKAGIAAPAYLDNVRIG